MVLEKASSELLELDECLQEESSAAPVASSSLATQPEHGCHDDDLSTDDSPTDAADTRADQCAPAATRGSDDAPWRRKTFVAGPVQAAEGSTPFVSYVCTC